MIPIDPDSESLNRSLKMGCSASIDNDPLRVNYALEYHLNNEIENLETRLSREAKELRTKAKAILDNLVSQFEKRKKPCTCRSNCNEGFEIVIAEVQAQESSFTLNLIKKDQYIDMACEVFETLLTANEYTWKRMTKNESKHSSKTIMYYLVERKPWIPEDPKKLLPKI